MGPGSWSSLGEGGGGKQDPAAALGTGEEQFIHPGSPRADATVQDLTLKINWGCLGARVGLLLARSLIVSGPLLMGTQLAQSFPTSLLPSSPGLSLRVCLEAAVRAPPLISVSVSCTLQQLSLPCERLCISDWLSPNSWPLWISTSECPSLASQGLYGAECLGPHPTLLSTP